MNYPILIALGIFLLSGCSISSPFISTPTFNPEHTEFITPIAPIPSKLAELTIPTASQAPIPSSDSNLINQKHELINLQNSSHLEEVRTVMIENPGKVFWLPDGNSMAVISYREYYIINIPAMSIHKKEMIPENETLLDFSPEKELMAFTTDRNSVTIKEMNGEIIQTITPEGGFGSAAFSPSGEALWLTSMEKLETSAYEINSGNVITTCGGFESAAPVYSAFPSPHGKWLVWLARATIQLNEIPSCKPGVNIGHEDFIISYTFTSDEQTLITSTGGTLNNIFQPLVFFRDARTGKQTGVIPLNESPAASLALSPNDEILVTAGNGLIIWNMNTKEEIRQLIPIGTRVNFAAFSPDGKSLVAADENSIRLFMVQP